MATLVDRNHMLATEEAQAIADYLTGEQVPASRADMRQALEAIVKQFRTADLHLTVTPGYQSGQCGIVVRERPRMLIIQHYELATSPLAVGVIALPDDVAQRWIDLADSGE